MSKGIVCLRFDVDTPRCLVEGMPALLDLAAEFDVPFTFFVNPGRAVDWRSLIPLRSKTVTTRKLSVRRKLGTRGLLYTAARNPRLSRLSGRSVVARAVREKHEIGLHGGRNHATWMRRAHRWPLNRLAAEVEWGLSAIQEMGSGRVRSFASPGWNTSKFLPQVLSGLGIGVLADDRGDEEMCISRDAETGVIRVHTHLTGEPDGVGYFEWRAAEGDGPKDVALALSESVGGTARAFLVVYDHPCFSGVEGLAVVREVVAGCRQQGCEFRTITEVAGTVPR